MLLDLSTTTKRQSSPHLVLDMLPTMSMEILSHGLVGTSMGLQTLLSIVGFIDTPKYASSNEPNYLFLHFGLVHITFQIGYCFRNTKVTCNFGSMRLSYKLCFVFFLLQVPIAFPTCTTTHFENFSMPWCHLLLHELGLANTKISTLTSHLCVLLSICFMHERLHVQKNSQNSNFRCQCS